jgi:hypothetical protein
MKFQSIVHTCEETMEVECTTGSYANERMISAYVHCGRKTIQLLKSSNIGRLNLCIKLSAKCETVAKIQHIQTAKLWSNGRVYYNSYFPSP